MPRTFKLAFVVSTFALLAHAALPGCSKEEEPECTKNSQCTSATTGCTVGVCKEGTCVGQPVADGTRYPDQSSVATKWCVVLKCKAGLPVETADGSKTPEAIECKKQTCDGTTLKVDNIGEGVGCGGGGACRGGVCMPPIDSGTPTDTGSTGDTGSTEDGSSDVGGD